MQKSVNPLYSPLAIYTISHIAVKIGIVRYDTGFRVEWTDSSAQRRLEIKWKWAATSKSRAIPAKASASEQLLFAHNYSSNLEWTDTYYIVLNCATNLIWPKDTHPSVVLKSKSREFTAEMQRSRTENLCFRQFWCLSLSNYVLHRH